MNLFTHLMAAMVGILAVIGVAVGALLGLAILAADIFLMVKAYGGEEFEIPTLGPMARQWV